MYLQFDDVRNPIYANENKTAINCEVLFRHLPGEYVPFTATPDDPQAWGRDIFAQCDRRKWGDVSPYAAPKIDWKGQAEEQRQTLLNISNAATADWRTEAALGEINETDKNQLLQWIDFNKKLKALIFDGIDSPEKYDSIAWPEQP
jgi:Caudovirales tail fibre assembly protein.